MRFRMAILSMTSAAALLACRGELQIGGEPDGGSSGPHSGPVPSEAGRGVPVTDTPPSGPAQTVVSNNEVIDAAPTVVGDNEMAEQDSAAPRLIVLDASVGGLCSSVNTRDPSYDEPYCGCTRRPGPGTSFFDCPPGIGNNASVTLDPSSVTPTTLSLKGRQVLTQIEFAPGAVRTPTTVTFIETSIPPPADIMDWSPIYAVEPLGLAIANGARLQLGYSNAPNSSGSTSIPSGLAIWFSSDGSCFTRLPDSRGNAGFNTGSLSQLGYLMVGVPRNASTAACP